METKIFGVDKVGFENSIFNYLKDEYPELVMNYENYKHLLDLEYYNIEHPHIFINEVTIYNIIKSLDIVNGCSFACYIASFTNNIHIHIDDNYQNYLIIEEEEEEEEDIY